MIKHLVVLSLFVGACDDSKTCNDALSNVLGQPVGLTALGIDAAHVPDVRKLGALSCKYEPWSEMTRTCLARASEATMMRACLGNPELEAFRVAAAGVADPHGVRRHPELEAVVREIGDASTIADDSAAACPGGINVEVVDEALIGEILTRRPQTPAHALTRSSNLGRYVTQAGLTGYEMDALRTWAARLPANRMWAFLETKQRIQPVVNSVWSFRPGVFEGALRVVDPRSNNVVCSVDVNARSSSSVVTGFVSREEAMRVNGISLEAPSEDKVREIADAVDNDFKQAIANAVDGAVRSLRSPAPRTPRTARL